MKKIREASCCAEIYYARNLITYIVCVINDGCVLKCTNENVLILQMSENLLRLVSLDTKVALRNVAALEVYGVKLT